MSHTDACTRTPSGLTIGISVASAMRGVVDRSGSATYIVEVRNRRLGSFLVSADSECKDHHVWFVPNGTNSNQWRTSQITVRPRPGSGGYSRFSKSVPLVSSGKDTDQSIRSDVTWTPVGFTVSGSESLYVQVDTV